MQPVVSLIFMSYDPAGLHWTWNALVNRIFYGQERLVIACYFLISLSFPATRPNYSYSTFLYA